LNNLFYLKVCPVELLIGFAVILFSEKGLGCLLLVGTNSHPDAILSVFPSPGRRPSPAGSVLLSGWLAGEFPADHNIQSPDNLSIGQQGTGGLPPSQ
jgi:hypothetical protein